MICSVMIAMHTNSEKNNTFVVESLIAEDGKRTSKQITTFEIKREFRFCIISNFLMNFHSSIVIHEKDMNASSIRQSSIIIPESIQFEVVSVRVVL